VGLFGARQPLNTAIETARAVSVLTESANRSRPLLCRIFFDEPGSHFVGKCSRAVSVLTESETRSRLLVCRIVFDEPGSHFVGKCSRAVSVLTESANRSRPLLCRIFFDELGATSSENALDSPHLFLPLRWGRTVRLGLRRGVAKSLGDPRWGWRSTQRDFVPPSPPPLLPDATTPQ
jgi:hypothetical protein